MMRGSRSADTGELESVAETSEPARRRRHALVRGTGAGAVVLLFVVALSLPGGATLPMAYRDGPPPGFSGGFGEPACDACHFSEPTNDGVGAVSIDGLEAGFLPGREYLLTVRLTRPGLRAAGFQLTARFIEGGGQAGTLLPGSGEAERVAVTEDRGIQYAFQRLAGSTPAAEDTGRWTLRWTAPREGGVVRFDVAANAADGDESSSGDFVYSAFREQAPAPR